MLFIIIYDKSYRKIWKDMSGSYKIEIEIAKDFKFCLYMYKMLSMGKKFFFQK